MMDYLSDYYENTEEDQRFSSKHGRVEFLTTMRYIGKYFPKEKASGTRVLEIGAGTGNYSIPLSRMGYQVTAVELVENNLRVLRNKLNEADHLVVRQGNALDLNDIPDAAFDLVLLLGPMYHLCRKEDMLAALKNAYGKVSASGILMTAYCMNEATLVQWGFPQNASNFKLALKGRKLSRDYHCLSTEKDVFALVRLEDINELNDRLGLKREELIATDLFTRYMKHDVDQMDEDAFVLYLDYHFSICGRQDLIGVSNHTLDIIRKNPGTIFSSQ